MAGHRLAPMTSSWADALAGELAGINPWLRLGYSSPALCRYLSAESFDRKSWVALAGQAPAGCVSVRTHWLRGPLLELLAILPGFQGRGLGGEIVAWLAEEARRKGQANLWTISSEFNLSARSFYHRLGFEEQGRLPGLIRPGETEVLLRLRLDEESERAGG